MARNFYFPTNATNYNGPSGNYRFKIYYDDGTSRIENTNTELLAMGDLEIPFVIDATANRYKFANMSITFENTDDIFESGSYILNPTYKNETFLTLYKDNTVQWQGILEYDLTEKTDYYIDDSGNTKYRKIRLKFSDSMAYYWKNDITITDVGYSSSINIKNLWYNITSNIGFTSMTTRIDTDIRLPKAVSGYYTLNNDEWFLYKLSGSMQVSDYLKKTIEGYGIFAHNYDSWFDFHTRNGGFGGTTLVATDDILDIRFTKNDRPIEYLRSDVNKSWGTEVVTDYTASILNTNLYQLTYQVGTENDKRNSSYTIEDNNEVVATTYVKVDYGGEQTSGSFLDTVDSGSTNSLTRVGENWVTDWRVETGMILYFNDGYSLRRAHITAVNDNTVFFVPVFDLAVPLDGAGNHYVRRIPIDADGFDSNIIYKVNAIQEFALAATADYMQDKNEILELRLHGIDTYDNFNNRFQFNSVNYRAQEAKVDWEKNAVELRLYEVN